MIGGRRPEERRPNDHPLDAIGRDQREAIERDTTRRVGWSIRALTPQRHGFALTVVAVVLSLVGGTAGARALISGTTGIPVVDELLELRQSRHPHSARQSRDSSGLISGPQVSPDLRPLPGSTPSPAVSVPWGAYAGRALAIAYVARGGDWCFLFAHPAPKGGASETENPVTCQAPELVRQALETDAAVRATVVRSSGGLLGGYAVADARRVQVRGSKALLSVRLSAPWTPPGADGVPVRIFVAFPAAFLDRLPDARNARTGDDPLEYRIKVDR